MAHMNTRQRAKWYPFLVKRDGEKCRVCGKLPESGRLVIDHIDNDDSHTVASNLQLLCYRHNYLKSKGLVDHSPLYIYDAQGDIDLSITKSKPSSSELEKNARIEPAFRELLYDLMVDKGEVLYDRAFLDEMAERVGCSQVTLGRSYVPKVVSKAGFYWMEERTDGNGDIERWIRWREEHAHHCEKYREAVGDKALKALPKSAGKNNGKAPVSAVHRHKSETQPT